MIRVFICLFLIIIPSSLLTAQEYFQQEVNYRIRVILDDSEGILRASENIEYINRSPDSLRFIYFHLWPNAYSRNSTDLAQQLFRIGGRQRLFNDPQKQGWIDSLDLKINNIPAELELLPGQPDVGKLILPFKLIPGDTIHISTPFRVKIPRGNISRMGVSNDIYQISQWYPKPAVYDKDGWHPISYLDQGEFYSEFGRYQVDITVPEDYVVGASGELLTGQEIDWLANIASDWRYPGMVNEGKPVFKNLRFSGDQIHDFAWVASKRFKVVTRVIELPGSSRKVTARVMYTPGQALLWEEAIEYVSRSILHFSGMIGDYPYGSFTAVQTSIAAGSGMEYPGLAIIGNVDDPYTLDQVISHEISHNWFYSSLGSNERRYPFMDESITSAYEQRYMNIYHPDKKLWELYFRNQKVARLMKIDQLPVERLSEIQWLIMARSNLEQPPNLAAQAYTDRNYSDIIYYKAAQGFNYLRSFLGDSLFDSIIRDYYSEWKGRHPAPEDLYTIFRERSGKDLSWFFDDFLGTVKRYNYKVQRIAGNSILVKNTGEMNSPLNVGMYKNDSLLQTAWIEGFGGSKWIDLSFPDFDQVKLNPDHLIPELNYTDNNIRRLGLFKKSDPMAPSVLSSVEDPERRTLILLPLLNWNRADGFMAGFALDNGFMLPKSVEFIFMPFYKFNEPGLSGKGRVAINLTPYNSIIRKLTFSLEGAQFGATVNNNYTTLKPGIDIWFRNRNMLNSTNHQISGRFIHATDIQAIVGDSRAGTRDFWQTRYSFSGSGPLNPFDFSGTYEWNKTYGKVFMELNYRISYSGRNKGLDIRLFSGTMTKINPASDLYSFAASGRSGKELYLFQGDFPDRFSDYSQNFWSRQMINTEGSLVTPVNDSTGYNRSIISLSLSGNLPGFAGKLPVKPFADLVYASGNSKPYFYEAGLKAGIWNVFEVSMPFFVSRNLSSVRGTVKERIRFTLNLESILKVRI